MNYIVIDHSINHFLNNQILDKKHNLKYPGASVFNYFIDIAQAQKWTVLTADVFLKEIKSFNKAVTLSNEFTSYLSSLIKKGVKPGLLISGESPNIARKFYSDLSKKSIDFNFACLFEGSLKMLNPNCIGYPFFWPTPSEICNSSPDFEKRNLVNMVAAYKGNFNAGLRSIPYIYFKSSQFKLKQFLHPSLRFIDLYPNRLKLIRTFANRNEFKLSGHGWEFAINNSKKFKNISFANFPSACDDKLHELSLGKFAIIFENCIYPGYITEKIFDAFRANTVPVYFGAPDISKFVSTNCFIDYRNFKTENDLWYFLETMSKRDWLYYRKNINEFMNSLSYKQFEELSVANFWFKLIDSI